MSDPGAGVEWVDTAEEEVVVVVTEDGLPPADDTAAGRQAGGSEPRPERVLSRSLAQSAGCWGGFLLWNAQNGLFFSFFAPPLPPAFLRFPFPQWSDGKNKINQRI